MTTRVLTFNAKPFGVTLAFSQDGKLLASTDKTGVITLLDLVKGVVLKSIDLGFGIDRLAFSRRGLHLETDKGLLSLEDIADPAPGIQPERPCRLLVRGNWVTWDMKNLFWLPNWYREVRASCESNVIAFLGLRDGLTFIEFGPRKTEALDADYEELDQDD